MEDFVTDLDLLTDCRLLCSRIYATLNRLPDQEASATFHTIKEIQKASLF
jgi:hypothetical protein